MVDLATITKIRIMQNMQAVVEEEEVKDHGGALEAEVVIKTETTAIQMVARFVGN